MSIKKTSVATQVGAILSSFSKFKEKDVGIRRKAKDIFTQARKRINERKIKNIKEKINKI